MKEAKTFEMIRMDKNEEVIHPWPWSRKFSAYGYDFVIHHPYETPKQGWFVSEISSGMRVSNSVEKTMELAEKAALIRLEKFEGILEEAVEKGRKRKSLVRRIEI